MDKRKKSVNFEKAEHFSFVYMKECWARVRPSRKSTGSEFHTAYDEASE